MDTKKSFLLKERERSNKALANKGKTIRLKT